MDCGKNFQAAIAIGTAQNVERSRPLLPFSVPSPKPELKHNAASTTLALKSRMDSVYRFSFEKYLLGYWNCFQKSVGCIE
jgi:hypothetical protein